MGSGTGGPLARHVRLRHLGRPSALRGARPNGREAPVLHAPRRGLLLRVGDQEPLDPGVCLSPRGPDFLVFENTLSDNTLFEGIMQPAAGSFPSCPRRGSRRSSILDGPDRVDEGITEAAAVRELRDLIVDAVEMRLQADVPVGMYLSGGLDSSLIACIARPGVVFTSCCCDYPGKFDEREPARRVAARIEARGASSPPCSRRRPGPPRRPLPIISSAHRRLAAVQFRARPSGPLTRQGGSQWPGG